MKLSFRVISSVEYMPVFQAETVFQTAEWMNIYSVDMRYKAVFCCLYGEEGDLVMLQPLLFHDVLPIGKFGRIAIAWGEPLCLGSAIGKREESLEVLVREMKMYVRTKALVLEFRHWGGSTPGVDIFKREGFRVLEWCNVINDYANFGGDVDKMLSSRSLKRIDGEMKKGLLVNSKPTEESWHKLYEMLKALYKRIHRPLPNYDFFRYCMNRGALCITIEQGEEVLAGVVVLILPQKEAYLLYGTANKEDNRHRSAGLLARYSALKLSQDYGVKRFNFLGGGARGKQYGVRDFKLKFGGELIDEYRFRKFLI